MARSNRQCYLCQVKYEYCPDCGRHDPAYMKTFCSTNCRDIFQTLSRYGVGLINAEECKEYLGMLDLSKKDSYKESTINAINKVYATSESVEKVVDEQSVETVIEEQPVKEVVEESDEEQVVEEQVLETKVEEKEVTVPSFERKSRKRNHEVVLEDIQ